MRDNGNTVQLALHLSRSCVNPRSAPCSSSCCPRSGRRLNRRQPRRLRLRLWCPGSAWSPPPSSCPGMPAPDSHLGVVGRKAAWLGIGDGRGRAVGPPAQARHALPARFQDPGLRRSHPWRRRGPHGGRPPGAHDDHLQPRHLHGAAAHPRAARRTWAPRPARRRDRPPARDCRLASAPRSSTRGRDRSAASTPRGTPGQGVPALRESAKAQRASSARRGRRARRIIPRTRCPTRRAPSRITVDRERAARELIPIAIAAGIAPRATCWPTYRGLLTGAERFYRRARRARRRASAPRSCRSTRRTTGSISRSSGRRSTSTSSCVCNPDLGCGLGGRLGPSGAERAAGLRLVLRRRRGHQLVRDDVGRACTDLVREGLRFFAQVPARRRQDHARDLAGRRAAAAGSPTTPTPTTTPTRRRTGSWRCGSTGARRATTPCSRELWPALQQGLGVVPDDRHGWRRAHREHHGRPRRDRGRGDRRGHPSGRLSRRGVGARNRRDARDGRRPRRARTSRREAAALRASRAADRSTSKYWLPERRSPRVRDPEVGRHERHADRVAGHGGRLRGVRPRHAAPRRWRALSASHRADDRLGRADARRTTSPLYEPLHYNKGAVWPFVTGFVAARALPLRSPVGWLSADRGADAA